MLRSMIVGVFHNQARWGMFSKFVLTMPGYDVFRESGTIFRCLAGFQRFEMSLCIFRVDPGFVKRIFNPLMPGNKSRNILPLASILPQRPESFALFRRAG